jgi:7,8-dihydropterin-6-yl-methyl-4-(beta-D-ribofuranosyl)aminobenzene 5'-phosphate synthase
MLQTEIIILSNNICLPFQNLRKEYGLDFIDLNKLYSTKLIAEHGLGFLINVYDLDQLDENWNPNLINRLIFDTGGQNLTFLHNLDIFGYSLTQIDNIILSHWHYDHTGGLYKILERLKDNTQIITHNDARFERFFKRSEEIEKKDMMGKTRDDIASLLSSSKIENQDPINLEKIEKLNGRVFYSKANYELLNNKGLKITVSGEITRKYPAEDFDNFFSLQNGTLEVDKILDDKCLIFEFEENIILLNGCCHSGIMNTLDYVKKISDKPISHIIGGFHMANASNERMIETIEYLRKFQNYQKTLYIFPIHCSGHRFVDELNKIKFPDIKAFDVSVGTILIFKTGF